ncbi:MAG: serine hydrolase [Microcoleaceae cyanobacterium]
MQPVIPEFPPTPDPQLEERVTELEIKLRRASKAIVQLQKRVAYLENDQPQAALRSPSQNPRNTRSSRKSSRKRSSSIQWVRSILVWSSGILLGATGAILALRFLTPLASHGTRGENPAPSTVASSTLTLADTHNVSTPLPVSPALQTSKTSETSKVSKTSKTSKTSNLIYSPRVTPDLRYSVELQTIVDEGVNLAVSQNLPVETLSIHLIDVQYKAFAEYRSQTLRFPASVAKLFWMAALYGQVEAKQLPEQLVSYTPDCLTDICKLIQDSDNESASHIVDQLAHPTATVETQLKDYKTWLNQRHSVNRFFQNAGYKQIDISQKNYPIPSLTMDYPEGWELKMRGNPDKPIRNRISAAQAGRLMYEIVLGKAISPKASKAMIELLTRNLNPETWQQEEYTALYEFLGEPFVGQPVEFASKVGWTSDSRTETAFIRDQSGKVAYILTVFAEGVPYSADATFFPGLSQMVYDRMIALNKG